MVRCGDRYSEECRCITDGERLTDTPADLRDFFRPLATLPVASARPAGCASPLRCRVTTLCLIAVAGGARSSAGIRRWAHRAGRCTESVRGSLLRATTARCRDFGQSTNKIHLPAKVGAQGCAYVAHTTPVRAAVALTQRISLVSRKETPGVRSCSSTLRRVSIRLERGMYLHG